MGSDKENPEWTETDFANAKSPEELPSELLAAFPNTAKRGRPFGSRTSNKQQVTLRLDKDVIASYQASGPGWQSRINEDLRKVAGL